MIRAGTTTGRAIRRLDAEPGRPVRAKPDRAEQRLHIACVHFLRTCCAPPPDGPFFCHPYNGGYRTPREASLGKALGVRAGTCDLLLLWRGHLIAVEFKSAKGRISLDQMGAQSELRMSGASVRVVRTPEEFQAVLDLFEIPRRGRIAA